MVAERPEGALAPSAPNASVLAKSAARDGAGFAHLMDELDSSDVARRRAASSACGALAEHMPLAFVPFVERLARAAGELGGDGGEHLTLTLATVAVHSQQSTLRVVRYFCNWMQRDRMDPLALAAVQGLARVLGHFPAAGREAVGPLMMYLRHPEPSVRHQALDAARSLLLARQPFAQALLPAVTQITTRPYVEEPDAATTRLLERLRQETAGMGLRWRHGRAEVTLVGEGRKRATLIVNRHEARLVLSSKWVAPKAIAKDARILIGLQRRNYVLLRNESDLEFVLVCLGPLRSSTKPLAGAAKAAVRAAAARGAAAKSGARPPARAH